MCIVDLATIMTARVTTYVNDATICTSYLEPLCTLKYLQENFHGLKKWRIKSNEKRFLLNIAGELGNLEPHSYI